MKNTIKILFCISIMIILLFLAIPISIAANSTAPTRVLNVVYDDSGSMYMDNNMMWSQAKYAAEVFAVMLGEKDQMNIYLMSDFLASPSIRTPRLQLSGHSGAVANVKAVHEMEIVQASNTPFGVVELAYNDLLTVQADEKWLVVLTDGDFNGVSKSQENVFFAAKSSDVFVYYLVMGDDVASGFNEDRDNNIFYAHAIDGDEVLENITIMGTRIFNFNRLAVNPLQLHIEFDIPMRELTVFAQGQNVNIAGIINSTGSLIKGNTPVNVRHSTQPAINYPDAPYDASLNGYLATFSGEFPAGDYTLSITGAQTIEVFYKPDVEIDVFLTDDTDREITVDKLDEGEYILNFCFVEGGAKARIAESSLLGDIRYTAAIVSNGVKRDGLFTNGDRITLEEGTHRIDATAVYLDYNTVETDLVISIYRDKPISVGEGDASETTYRLTEYGFDRDDPFTLNVQLDGKDFTGAEWARLSAPNITGGNEMLSFRTEKGSVGEINIYPVFMGSTREEAEIAMGRHDTQAELKLTQADDESWGGLIDLSIYIESGYREISYVPAGDIPSYKIDRDGIVNADEPILVEALLEGGKITDSEWALMNELPEAVAAAGNIGAFRVEKTGETGQYALYPTLFQDNIYKTDAVDGEIQFSYTERVGNEVWLGDGTGEGGLKLAMTDSRSWLTKNRQRLMCGGIIGLIALFILGYVPPFKKYLPRSLKRRPIINCVMKRPGINGIKPQPSKGDLDKGNLSRFIPYKAETAKIRFVPKGVAGIPKLEVKASGGNSMNIINIKQYAGKNHIRFQGDSIPSGTTKPKLVSAGVLIEAVTDTVTYVCQPNQ